MESVREIGLEATIVSMLNQCKMMELLCSMV
jgi:hypothetical protein